MDEDATRPAQPDDIAVEGEGGPSEGRRWPLLVRVLATAVVGALLLVVALNVWLAVWGETTFSRRPDKLQVSWASAWSPWPGRVHVRDLVLSAQPRRNQWELTAERATLEIGLRDLLDREFVLRRGRGDGVTFRMRRRLGDGVTVEDAEHFPPITGFELAPVGEARERRRDPWRIALLDVALDEVREIWIEEIRLLPRHGSVTGGLDMEIRGPFSLDDLAFDLEGPLTVAGRRASEGLTVVTDLRLAPTRSRDWRSAELYEGLEGTVRVGGEVDGLGFLDPMLPDRRNFAVEGRGSVQLDVTVAAGAVVEPSTLLVEARDLSVGVGPVSGSGEGRLRGEVRTEADHQLAEFRFTLDDVGVGSTRLQRTLARADRFDLVIEGRNPRLGQGMEDTRFLLELPELEVPDLAAFDPLLPRGLGVELVGGTGTARTRIELGEEEERSEFELHVEDARIRFRGTTIGGDLEVGGRTVGSVEDRRFVLHDGTARFAGTTRPDDSAAARAPVRFELRFGETAVLGGRGEGTDVVSGMRLADGAVEISGTIEDLGWWETPVGGADWLKLAGRGEVVASLHVSGVGPSTRIVPPSTVRVEFPDLSAGLGPWNARSAGILRGELVRGAGSTGSRLEVRLEQPRVRRGDREALEGSLLTLQAEGPDLARGLRRDDVELRLDMEPASVPDLTVFNGYLPADRLAFVSGAGRLEGQLRHSSVRSSAELELRSGGARAMVLGRPFDAVVKLDAGLLSSDPLSRRYRVAEGTLRLEEVGFEGRDGTVEGWWAVADLEEGTVVVDRPLQVDARARLRLRDTVPIVEMLGESHRVVRWFSGLLEVDDIEGTGRIVLDAAGTRLLDLDVGGDDGLRIRGRVDLREETAALLLIELRGLRAGFEKIGDWRDVNVLRPERWFEERRAVWDQPRRERPRP